LRRTQITVVERKRGFSFTFTLWSKLGAMFLKYRAYS
jgi:hypothetical protein